MLTDDTCQKAVKDSDILSMLLTPAWCFICNKPSWVEEIPSLRFLENLSIVIKSGEKIEFPFDNSFMSEQEALSLLRDYCRWLAKRRTKGKCVECAGQKYSLLGEEHEVRLKHEHCDYGVFKPGYMFFSSNGPMQTRMYSVEGNPLGRLSHWDDNLGGWSLIKDNGNV
ncbi:hypothetical protein ACJJIU_03715 [Microbulbifer sp. CnH-101-E]|uniref:hypothetical protein n=1 Tax=unclassified Microbulbifer TaxID=2619833 RepID=UPI00403A1C66